MQKIAFIFPGQGSQSVGMLSAFANYPQIKTTFEKASSVLNYDLWDLIQNDSKAQLNETQYTQPAILTASIALWHIWKDEQGLTPSVMAGHSLGEYSALVAANSLAFEDAVYLVAKRGELMQQAVPEGFGAMAAVLGLSDDEVITICEQAKQDEVLSAVNFNAPGQVVIAGHKTALARALQLVKDAGKRALPLPVSVPSHCFLMKPAADQLAEILKSITIKTPDIPVYNNVDVACAQLASDIQSALVRQLYSPVRWVEIINAMSLETSVFVECGPGKVLSGLNKRINSELTTYPITEPDLLTSALRS